MPKLCIFPTLRSHVTLHRVAPWRVVLQGFGEAYVALDHERTGNALYLHEKWHKVWAQVGTKFWFSATVHVQAELQLGLKGGGQPALFP